MHESERNRTDMPEGSAHYKQHTIVMEGDTTHTQRKPAILTVSGFIPGKKVANINRTG